MAYPDTQALSHVFLHVPAGQTTVLIGPSGCGKSTVLRLIVGLIFPNTGTLYFGQERLAPANLQSFRRRMGYVIQEGGLFPHLTVAKNITLMAEHLNWDQARLTERLKTLTELVQLPASLLERYPGELSGGQRQRVSLIRALMLDPELLLLDEPLGALDPMIRHELQQDLKDVFQRLGKTVLMVTHDMGEAAYFGDRIVLLRAGRIVQQGPLGELVDRPAEPFVEQFINAQRSPLELLNRREK